MPGVPADHLQGMRRHQGLSLRWGHPTTGEGSRGCCCCFVHKFMCMTGVLAGPAQLVRSSARLDRQRPEHPLLKKNTRPIKYPPPSRGGDRFSDQTKRRGTSCKVVGNPLSLTPLAVFQPRHPTLRCAECVAANAPLFGDPPPGPRRPSGPTASHSARPPGSFRVPQKSGSRTTRGFLALIAPR